MKSFFVAAAAAASANALTVEEAHLGMFNNWQKAHDKSYANIDEEEARFEVFMKNHDLVEKHNANPDKGFEMKLNQFADLTAEEFKQHYTGFRPTLGHKSNADYIHEVTEAAPGAKDWRKTGKVTAVKNQGSCGSCWSFSTTGSIEAANLIKHGGSASDRANILSEQQLVDCSKANSGCNGGLMDLAFDYLKKLGKKGDDTESSYAYTARDGRCKATSGTASNVQVTGYVDIPVGSEDALRNAVGTVGPVSVAIEADQLAFQFYSGGILTGKCGQNLDHGVLAVGYGSENGQDYWIVKNSWGATWGEEGYIRIAIGKNLCGISNSASYPLIN